MPSVYIQSSVFLPTPSGGAGAVELLVAKMAEGLAKRGWDVTLFGLAGSKIEGVAVIEFDFTAQVDTQERERVIVRHVKWNADSFRPDVIFDHSLHMFAGQRRGPYVAMSHGMAPLPSWAHNVVFTSQHHGRLHGRKDAKALLLGIDLADIPPVQVEPTWADGRITEVSMVPREGLFWAGRIMPYKRLHLALDIARFAGQPLRIAGPIVDEPYARLIWNTFDIHDDDASCGDAAHAHYLGELPRAQVLEEMARARYFLFTSDETEPAGLTMLEAQACGTPVIALNDSSAHEYIGGGGWIFPGEDVGAAANLIREERNREIAGCDARAAVENGFTIDHMVDRAEEYLRRAMAGERW